MFLLAVLATIVGFMIPVSQSEAQIISDQLNQTVTQGTQNGTLIPDIFLNNYRLCLLMFIPLAGAALGLGILFFTGQAFRAVLEIQASGGAAAASSAAAANMTASAAILTLVMIALVFLLEYVSYTIAMTESVWLFRRLLQNKWKGELKYLLIFIGTVTAFLIIGAVVETLTITGAV